MGKTPARTGMMPGEVIDKILKLDAEFVAIRETVARLANIASGFNPVVRNMLLSVDTELSGLLWTTVKPTMEYVERLREE